MHRCGCTAFVRRSTQHPHSADISLVPSDVTAILRLEVPIIVRLAERTMKVSDILGLVPGAIIELTKSAEEELDVLVNNKCIGRGEAVKVGENFGVRISTIGDARDRIAALGGE